MEQVAWILSLLLAFIVAPLLLWSQRERQRRRTIPSDPHTPDEHSAGQDMMVASSSTERSSMGGTRRMRRRPTSAAASSSSSSSAPSVAVFEEDGNQDPDGNVEATYYKAKQLKKKKQERKQENEVRRQAEIEARDLRREKQDRQADMRRRRDEEHEAEDVRKEEEAEQLKLQQEQQAAAEFEKWRVAFSVETEGTDAQDVEEGQSRLNDFVNYIEKHKCVELEDLASEFNLRTQDCISRLTALEQAGRLSGLMDERGKFIYISPEEMKAVADYIKRLGRVSISHLASISNEFIDLKTKNLVLDTPQVS